MAVKKPSVRSIEERNILVIQFKALPYYVVNKLWSYPFVQSLGYDDATQIGFLSLIRAAELWEENRGIDFKTYAYRSVLRGILGRATKERKHDADKIIAENIIDPKCENVQDLFDREEAGDLLKLLPPRMRDVIRITCLNGEHYKVAGKKHNLSKERIRQIRDKALRWLRSYLNGDDPARLVDIK